MELKGSLQKYLTFGYHELITLWMDEYGLPIYRDVVSIIHQGMVFQKQGVTILRLDKDKICYVDKTEYKSVLKECMKFFLEKEEYLDCAKVRDLLEGKLIKTKSKKKRLKTII